MQTTNIPTMIERSEIRYRCVERPDGSFMGGLIHMIDPVTGRDDLVGSEVFCRERLSWQHLAGSRAVTRDELGRCYSRAQNHTYCGEDNVLALEQIVAEHLLEWGTHQVPRHPRGAGRRRCVFPGDPQGV